MSGAWRISSEEGNTREWRSSRHRGRCARRRIKAMPDLRCGDSELAGKRQASNPQLLLAALHAEAAQEGDLECSR